MVDRFIGVDPLVVVHVNRGRRFFDALGLVSNSAKPESVVDRGFVKTGC